MRRLLRCQGYLGGGAEATERATSARTHCRQNVGLEIPVSVADFADAQVTVLVQVRRPAVRTGVDLCLLPGQMKSSLGCPCCGTIRQRQIPIERRPRNPERLADLVDPQAAVPVQALAACTRGSAPVIGWHPATACTRSCQTRSSPLPRMQQLLDQAGQMRHRASEAVPGARPPGYPRPLVFSTHASSPERFDLAPEA